MKFIICTIVVLLGNVGCSEYQSEYPRSSSSSTKTIGEYYMNGRGLKKGRDYTDAQSDALARQLQQAWDEAK